MYLNLSKRQRLMINPHSSLSILLPDSHHSEKFIMKSLKFHYFVLIVASVAATLMADQGPSNDLLNVFINNSVSTFRYFEVQDPLQLNEPTEIRISNTLFTIDGDVSDVEYYGLGQMRANYISSDTTSGKIHIECDFPNGTYAGKFNLVGMANREPFGGEGSWDFKPYFSSRFFSINIDFYSIDGFVVLRGPYVYLSDNDLLTPTFNGLFDGSNISEDVQKAIEKELAENIRAILRRKVENYLKTELTAHLQLDFDQVPLFDIISGVTLPPRTTETPGCNFDLEEELSKWGYSLTSLDASEVVLSSEVVDRNSERIVMEIVKKTRIVIPSH